MGWSDIPSAEEIEIPKVPHQDHVDNFFSTLKAQYTKNSYQREKQYMQNFIKE
jgi:hypothetical protein